MSDENGHSHGHDHDHEHDHDRGHAEDAETLSVQIANQIINIANARLQDGHAPAVIADSLRQAAANFSAFAEARAHEPDPGRLIEEFAQLLEYYWGRHVGADAPGSGLNTLVEQAKREF